MKAFRSLGYVAYGVDASKWAVENVDPEVKEYVRLAPWYPKVDWVIAKDVLEHVEDVSAEVQKLMSCARVGLFAVVPLSVVDGEPYVVSDYEKDVTHVHRLTLGSWACLFVQPGWEVTASFRVRGVKDNYFDASLHPSHFPEWETGNGFIVCRRQLA